jgi:hypothetical protein
VQARVSGALNTLRIRLRNDFGFSSSLQLPALGNTSEGLRVLSETWSTTRDLLTLKLQGKPGHSYPLGLWNPAQVATVEGGSLSKSDSGAVYLNVEFPEASDQQQLILHFVSGSKVKNRAKR